MAMIEKVVASTNGERERCVSLLTDIDGIARKTAEAMYEMEIRGYADLDQYLSQRTAEQISAALKEHGVRRPPAFIDRETWVRQAREFGGLDGAAPAPPEEEPEPTTEAADSPSRGIAREHDAEFTVFFDVTTDGDREPVLRTTVRDSTNGDQKEVFRGSNTAPWVNWMLERADVPSSMTQNGARIAFGDVQLSAHGSASDPQGRRLKAEISFHVSGSGAEVLTSRGLPFRVEGYTVDAETGVSELVASDRGQLVPQVFEYREQQEFLMPAVGRYEFYSIVLLLPPGELAAYRQGPTMTIIP